MLQKLKRLGKALFKREPPRDEVIEWCSDGICLKNKRDLELFDEPIHSVAVKPGVYSVNNVAIFADDHIEAIRKYHEREQSSP